MTVLSPRLIGIVGACFGCFFTTNAHARVFCNADVKFGELAIVSSEGASFFFEAQVAFIRSLIEIESGDFVAASEAGSDSITSLRTAAKKFEESTKAVDDSLNKELMAVDVRDIATVANVSLDNPLLDPISGAIERGDASALFVLCNEAALSLARLTEPFMAKLSELDKEDALPLSEINTLWQQWHNANALGVAVTATFTVTSQNGPMR